MKKFFYSFLLLFVLGTGSVLAQQGTASLTINFSGASPLGDFKDMVPGWSLRGANGTLLFGITDEIYAGLGIGFQDFYHKHPRQVYRTAEGDISAVRSFSIQTVPILLSGRYIFRSEAKLQPYGALGLGANLVSYREMLGEFGGTETKFRFAAKPELGLQIPFGRFRESAINFAAAYNFMPFNEFGIANLNNVSLQAGIKFPMRR